MFMFHYHIIFMLLRSQGYKIFLEFQMTNGFPHTSDYYYKMYVHYQPFSYDYSKPQTKPTNIPL